MLFLDEGIKDVTKVCIVILDIFAFEPAFFELE